MSKITRRTMIAATLVGAAAFSAGSVAAEKTYHWKIQTLWQPGTANQLAFERFAKNVDLMTDGQIKITPLPSGAVVGVTETIDAVKQHILDGHHTATSYWTGLNPAFAALGDLNGAYDSPYQAMEYFYNYGGMELLEEAYEPLGLYPIGVAWWGVESIPSSKPLRSTADLKGVKIRLPQGMASSLFAHFGAVPVNLAGSEVFSALDNGTIDATDWGTLSMNEELGFYDKAKSSVYPGVHSAPAGDVSIRLEDWKSLSPRLQTILKIAARNFSMDMIQTLDKANVELAATMADKGVELNDWSDEERLAFRNAAKEVWTEYSSKNDLTRRAVESQIAYLKLKGLLAD